MRLSSPKHGPRVILALMMWAQFVVPLVLFSVGALARNSAIISTVADWGFVAFPLKRRSTLRRSNLMLALKSSSVRFISAKRGEILGIFRRRSIPLALIAVTGRGNRILPTFAQGLYCNAGDLGKSKHATLSQLIRRKLLSDALHPWSAPSCLEGDAAPDGGRI
jgi:hypothetical protein